MSPSLSRAVALSCAIAFCMGLAPRSSALAAEKPASPAMEIEQLRVAMEVLGERASAVRIRWHEVVQLNAGGALTPDQAKEMEMEGDAAVTGLPTRSLRFECPGELLLKNDWMRLSTKVCEQSNGTPRPLGWVSANDGVQSRFVEVSEDGAKQGEVLTIEENHQSHSVRIMPFLLYLRPFSAPFNILKRERLALKDPNARLGARQCILLDDGDTRVWVDPARACIPLAIEEYLADGRKTWRTDIEYQSHPVLYWFPSRYSVQVFDPGQQGKVKESHVADQITVEPRLPLEQRDFALTFAPGTTVYDEKTKERYQIGADGSRQSLTTHRSAKRLAFTPGKTTSRLPFVIAANVLCLIAIGLAWLLIRRRRRQ
jgi:hypothetical protein